MTAEPSGAGTGAGRSRGSRWMLGVLALLLFTGFVLLGNWQVQRRAWKLDLIARVEQRVHATPQPPPPPERWAGISAEADAYRHVRLTGIFVQGHQTLVQAVTELGRGFWLLAPLRTSDGRIVYINRGFVPRSWLLADAREPAPTGPVTISGLLRISEPGGAFLHDNDPQAGRWYSRDVAALAASDGLPAADVAPYFVDADAGPDAGAGSGRWPRGGLTVVRFHNSHLVYALTWYTLALMVIVGVVVVVRQDAGSRKQ